MLLADVHAHIDLFPVQEIPGVVGRAVKAGVKVIVSNGVDPKTNRASLELAAKYPIVRPALGLYPVDSLKLSEQEVAGELEFIKKSRDRIVGIGEVGLDYLKADERKRQTEIFLSQVELAARIGKPLIVHSRKAEQDVVSLLVSHSAKKVVMHCCMADMKTVKKAVDAGFCFSIPALVSRSSHFQKLVEALPIRHILTETDAPFLAPVKGGKSEPAMIADSMKVIARIKGLDLVECSNLVFSNYQGLFI